MTAIQRIHSQPGLSSGWLGWLVPVGVASITGILIALLPLSSLLTWAVLVVVILLFLITPINALVFLLILAPMRALIATEAGLSLPVDIGQALVIAFAAMWSFERILTSRRFTRPALVTRLVASAGVYRPRSVDRLRGLVDRGLAQ
ncbi:hypothetical protein HC928_16800 [bacterium]|nr:hypothetical protein [bacterium]